MRGIIALIQIGACLVVLYLVLRFEQQTGILPDALRWLPPL